MKCARFFENQKIVHISNPNMSEIDAKLDYFQKNPTSFKKNYLCDHSNGTKKRRSDSESDGQSSDK